MLVEKATDLQGQERLSSLTSDRRARLILEAFWHWLQDETEQRLGQLYLFFTKSEARDKTGRLVQYACKALGGFADHTLQNWSSTEVQHDQQLDGVLDGVGVCWCSCIRHLRSVDVILKVEKYRMRTIIKL